MTMLIAGSEVLTFEKLSRKVGPVKFDRDGLWKCSFRVVYLHHDGLRDQTVGGLQDNTLCFCHYVVFEKGNISLFVSRVSTRGREGDPHYWRDLSRFSLPD